MNVKRLVEQLKKYDEDWDVLIESRYASYHFHVDKVTEGLIDKDLDEIIEDKKVVFLHEGQQMWMKKKKYKVERENMKSSRDILKESKLMDELKKGKIGKEDRAKKHILLDKLLDGCFIDPLTNNFYCKKCKCIVTIDWNKNEAFCVVDGLICACVSNEDLKEPVTITQDGKVWMLLGEEWEVE